MPLATMISGRRAALVLSLVAAFGVSGCVSPALDHHAYAEKAGLTLQDAGSELRTAELAATQWLDDRLFGTYAEVVVVDAGDALDDVSSTFRSVQPPADAASDELMRAVSDQLASGVDAMTELRIALRRDDRAAAQDAVAAVAAAADDVDALLADPMLATS